MTGTCLLKGSTALTHLTSFEPDQFSSQAHVRCIASISERSSFRVAQKHADPRHGEEQQQVGTCIVKVAICFRSELCQHPQYSWAPKQQMCPDFCSASLQSLVCHWVGVYRHISESNLLQWLVRCTCNSVRPNVRSFQLDVVSIKMHARLVEELQ